MITQRAISRNLLQKTLQGVLVSQEAQSHGHAPTIVRDREILGNRDWVGFGMNGSVHYIDRYEFPMPAIRFKPNTPDVLALREKEKGDWKNLTIAEKKKIYRDNFRQTLVEIDAPTGEWKSITAGILFLFSVTVWIYFLERKYVLGELPSSMSEENRRKYFRFVLDQRQGDITGLSSKWDHEKDDWKK